ncbi:MDR family MFS transporter [[Clostridium] fimetarium]|uniref:Drug resistance transporter, EmrB/QacA subfamily n=1 Tax=[Clostridium] fimetarium TaxID=99656 RepID=A0A1I0R6G1_9FIRM|nr:MDR family MFS transporter [[Clostridium] fimetarium]SEW36156.1 drug resistance transporter, EmrB/QacA subfamily [[Clostridium] fimetarium]
MDTRKKNIVIALMVAMFLGAVEGTVVTTAIPTIVKDLHGFEIISLVFSIYLLTSAISTPIYGKLSDQFGRKNVLSIGIVIFLIGSILCGLSKSMYMLIAFRALQGLGAGAIFTITYTIIGDEFSLEERPKVQGGIGTVWGVASLLGPFLGGFLINVLSWHWIFFINIPFGILSIVLLQKSLKETFQKKKVKIDFAGIIVLSMAMMIFLNIFLDSGSFGLQKNVFVILSICVTTLLLIVFYFIERIAKEPIIPFEIFTKTIINVNLISFLLSAILIGVDVYMAIYIQNILGFSPTISGLAMAPMSVAWLMSSVILGKCIMSYGEKAVIMISVFTLFISTLLFATLSVHSALTLVVLFSFVMGFGLGGAFTTLTIVVQTSVEYNKRGAATATNSLLRTLGQTIGVSIFGGIFNANIVDYFNKIGINGVDNRNLYSTASQMGVSGDQIKLSLNSSTHIIFIIFVLIAILCLVLSIGLPKVIRKKFVE